MYIVLGELLTIGRLDDEPHSHRGQPAQTRLQGRSDSSPFFPESSGALASAILRLHEGETTEQGERHCCPLGASTTYRTGRLCVAPSDAFRCMFGGTFYNTICC